MMGRFLDGYARRAEERGQSIYSEGLTPAQILNCMMQRFNQALAVIDKSVDFWDIEDFHNHIPTETIAAWLRTCINK